MSIDLPVVLVIVEVSRNTLPFLSLLCFYYWCPAREELFFHLTSGFNFVLTSFRNPSELHIYDFLIRNF